LHVPETGIVDYVKVSEKLAEEIRALGGDIQLAKQVESLRDLPGEKVIRAGEAEYAAAFFINCGGLQSDRVARLDGLDPGIAIVPFRGEYYDLNPEARGWVRNLIYPVPDPAFPFLGVHFTRMIGGGVECGPNAVLAFKREGYRKTDLDARDLAEVLANPGFRKLAAKHWRMGLGEFHRSFSKAAFVKALQRLLPDLEAAMIVPAGAGVRAQALRRDGTLVDDFEFAEGPKSLHVLNAPSPAATASLAIGAEITERYARLAGG
jgi:L-2-hydroxyglutarate oxidase LhgO